MSIDPLSIFPHKDMQFAPVEEDDDDISVDIQNDPITHENNWDLQENIDGERLEEFWADAVQELGVLEPEQSTEEVS